MFQGLRCLTDLNVKSGVRNELERGQTDLHGDVPSLQEGPGRKGHIPTAPKCGDAGAGLPGGLRKDFGLCWGGAGG